MFGCRIFAAGLLFVFTLAGCAGVPEVRYNKQTSKILKVALLEPGFPSNPSAYDTSRVQDTTGALGGLIGSLIGAAIDASAESGRNQELAEAIRAKGFNGRAQFRKSLVATLEAAGYEVKQVPGAARGRTEHVDGTIGTQPDADAVLDVVTIRYGFIQSGGQWRPHMQTKVRLTRTTDGTVLMQNLVTYQDPESRGKNIVIVPDSRFVWSDFDYVVTNPDKAILAMEDAIIKSATTIARLMQ